LGFVRCSVARSGRVSKYNMVPMKNCEIGSIASVLGTAIFDGRDRYGLSESFSR